MTLFIGVLASRGAIGAAGDSPVEDPAAFAARPKPPGAEEGSVTRIHRDESGQFRLNVTVDGQEARFLIDTGADTVALTVETAQELGYDVSPDTFEPLMETASGTGYGQWIEIDTMEIGGQTFRNVPAVVMNGLGTNLLGQTVLGRLGKMEMRGDTMILHHGRGGES